MIWVILILGFGLVTLIALKGWAWTKNRAKKAAVEVKMQSGLLLEDAESKVDDIVRDAERWWPYLRSNALFWIGCFFTCIMILLDFQFGISRAGLVGGIILGSLFMAADLALPFVCIKSDRGRSNWYDFSQSDRSATSWVLIVLFTLMSVVVVIGSTSEVATTTGARNTIGNTRYEATLDQISKWQAERDQLPVDRGYEALANLASATEEAAVREAGRGGCQTKCEALKREAAAYRARANDAKRKEELTQRIAEAQDRLRSMSNVRTDSDAFGSAVEGLSVGAVTKEQTARYGLTLIGIAIVIGGTLLWMTVADQVKADMRREWRKRGELADRWRAGQGLPPKYVQPEDPVALITHEKPADTIIVNVAGEDMLKRFPNDEELKTANGLFGTILDPADDGVLSVEEIYRAFQIAVLKADPGAKYMSRHTMAQKLATIALHRSDVRMTADNKIHGWMLVKAQAVEAAE